MPEEEKDYTLTPTETVWVVTVDVGNDWGEPHYLEERKYYTQADLEYALAHRNYYETIQEVKIATYFDFNIIRKEWD